MAKQMKFFNRKMKLTAFSAIITIYNLIAFNIPFFRFVAENVDTSAGNGVLIIASLAVLLLCLNFFACYLLVYLLRTVGKVIVAIANFLSAACAFFIQVYKIIIDDSMLSNVFNTQYSEASGFISFKLLLFVLIFGVIPSIWIIRQKVHYGSFKRFGSAVGISLGVSLIAVLLNMNNFLWVGKHDTQLGALLMPWSYTVNTGRLMAQRHQANRAEIKLSEATAIPQNGKTLVVLVIGESARKCNFSMYGYNRITNPLLCSRNDVVALDAKACATYTTAAVKAIVEPVNSDTLYEILPNYAYRCGADVVWRTSNWGEPPVHVDEYQSVDYLRENVSSQMGNMSAEDLPFDGVLLYGLKERILSSDKDRMLVVLHTSISHGPCYSKRYPGRFEQFTPVCDNVEQADKDIEGLVNAYDNTILYTDYVVDRTIDMMEGLEGWNCAMLFVSDHGESLGEDNLFMHGLPMSVAPATQYEIPFIVWSTPGFKTIRNDLGVIDQHYVFHSVMSVLGYEGESIDRTKSIFE